METMNMTSHQVLPLKSTYEQFVHNIELVLNHIEPGWSKDLKTDPDAIKTHLRAVAGTTGLMIFGVQQHGQLLQLEGISRKAIQYTIGNPLTALEMTKHDIRAALYAPVRILVYEDKDTALFVEYDLPSSQFGQFGPAVLAVAKDLDKKLADAILLADAQTEK